MDAKNKIDSQVQSNELNKILHTYTIALQCQKVEVNSIKIHTKEKGQLFAIITENVLWSSWEKRRMIAITSQLLGFNK